MLGAPGRFTLENGTDRAGTQREQGGTDGQQETGRRDAGRRRGAGGRRLRRALERGDEQHWTCAATPLKVLGGAHGVVGSSTSCTDRIGEALNVNIAGPLQGSTANSLGGFFGTEGNVAKAASSVARLDALGISARALESGATSSCRYADRGGDQGPGPVIMHSGQSRLASLVINGKPTALGSNTSAPQTIDVSPLLEVHLDRTIETETTVTQRAPEVVLLGQTVLVAGEASTGLRAIEGCLESPPIVIPPPEGETTAP